MTKLTICCFIFLFFYCVESKTYYGTIFARNWFKLWVNGKEVVTDPVIFSPQNAVKFSFNDNSPCRTYAIYATDGSNPSTGLQQDETCVGNGGIRITVSDGTVSNKNWKLHRKTYGPTNWRECSKHDTSNLCRTLKTTACAIQTYQFDPKWCSPGYTPDTAWLDATEYTEAKVGYGTKPTDPDNYLCVNPTSIVDWKTSKFIWGPDINFDNELVLRYTNCDAGATNTATVGTETCLLTKPTSQSSTCTANGVALRLNIVLIFAAILLLFAC